MKKNETWITFGFKTSKLREEQKQLEMDAARFEGDDAAWADEQIRRFKSQLALLSKLLDIVPPTTDEKLAVLYRPNLNRIPNHERWYPGETGSAVF